jgi:hypothetical protein
LVREKCAACHCVGGIGPFPLLTHADVQKRARQIVDVTRRRLMPPWAPLPNYCRFDHDLSLTANESGMIAQWADEGMLPGDPSQLAAPREFPEGWTQGEPDLVLT